MQHYFLTYLHTVTHLIYGTVKQQQPGYIKANVLSHYLRFIQKATDSRLIKIRIALVNSRLSHANGKRVYFGVWFILGVIGA